MFNGPTGTALKMTGFSALPLVPELVLSPAIVTFAGNPDVERLRVARGSARILQVLRIAERHPEFEPRINRAAAD